MMVSPDMASAHLICILFPTWQFVGARLKCPEKESQATSQESIYGSPLGPCNFFYNLEYSRFKLEYSRFKLEYSRFKVEYSRL